MNGPRPQAPISTPGAYGPLAWRILVIASAIAAAAALALTAFVYSSNRDAIEANRDLACRIGSFFVGQPIVKQPQQSEADFQLAVTRSLHFLHALRAVDCSAVRGAQISPGQLHHAIHGLRRVQPPSERAVGSTPPTQPSSGEVTTASATVPGETTTAAANPSPPSPTTTPPPSTTTPTTPPSTTTPAPPPTQTSPLAPVTEPVCHVSVLGVRICIKP